MSLMIMDDFQKVANNNTMIDSLQNATVTSIVTATAGPKCVLVVRLVVEDADACIDFGHLNGYDCDRRFSFWQ